MNITLNKRANNMRIHTSLPKIFWAEVVNTIAYLINRGSSVPRLQLGKRRMDREGSEFVTSEDL